MEGPGYPQSWPCTDLLESYPKAVSQSARRFWTWKFDAGCNYQILPIDGNVPAVWGPMKSNWRMCSPWCMVIVTTFNALFSVHRPERRIHQAGGVNECQRWPLPNNSPLKWPVWACCEYGILGIRVWTVSTRMLTGGSHLSWLVVYFFPLTNYFSLFLTILSF